jgi:alpha-2-macroglobulin
MRKSILFLVLLGVASLMLGPDSITYSQDAGDPPPRIIDIWPLPGVELAGQESLSITFDQAMDQNSVAAAFSTEPALDGSLTWTDARTVEFVPAEAWPRNTELSIEIQEDAQALTGVTLEETFRTAVKTIGPLAVSTIVPDTDATGVTADARIVVTFNRPVVALGVTEDMDALPSPITVDPDISGKGEWLNTSIYMLTPDAALQGGTRYTVTVDAGLTAVDGAVLDESFEWSFETLPPQILSIQPSDGASNVLLDADLTVRFSQPMEPASTADAFALLFRGERVEGDISWNDDNSVLTFSPAENLEIETTYILNIADTARSAAGEASLDRGYSQSFATVPLPGVERTTPRNGETDVYPGFGANITFKSPMNTETFADRIRVEPEGTEWEPFVNGNRNLRIQFNLQPLQTYQITLLAGAEDIYGNAIQTDYTFEFTTRDIETFAYPITQSGGLQLTGSYRNNTRLSVMVSGEPEVNFQLYQLDPMTLGRSSRDVLDYGHYGEELPPYVRNSNLVREWTQTFDSEGIPGVPKAIFLAGEEGGVLPNGLYWLRMDMPARWDENRREVYSVTVGVVNANLTVKRAPEETLVWVTDMPSAQPVQETTVSVIDEDGNTIARGQTDADGLFRTPVELSENDFFSVIADGAGAYGLWKAYDSGTPPTRESYVYTDRPIYRPGETVHFRGMLREKDDMDFTIPNLRAVNVGIFAADGSLLIDEDFELTPFGTFSGSIELTEDAALGQAQINVGGISFWTSVSFTVAEFRVPEFQVGVTAQQDSIFRGDELTAVANATFFAGGAVSNAELRWNALARQAFFNYAGPGNYTFTDSTIPGFFEYFVGSGEGMTDGSGNFIITTENTDIGSPVPATISVEASVTDESLQTISGRTSVMVHPSNAYVGLRSDRYFGREGEPIQIDAISVTPDSEPRAEQRITLTFVELRWSRIPVEGEFGRYTWEREEVEVETAEVFTDENGTVSYTFTPPNAGIFRVRATTLDERERLNSSSLRFYVTGSQSVWWGEPTDAIDLIANQDSYEVGETAEVLVPLPYSGGSTVLVTTERQGILSTEIIEVEGSTLVYELPIIESHVPTIHVSVAVVKGIDDESANPEYKLGNIALEVKPTSQTLTVTVTPSAETTQPGDTLSFDVQVTDAEGNPVEAELGVALTDKAILTLLPPNSGPVVDTFYRFQPNYIRTTIALEALLDRITDRTVGEDDDLREVTEESLGGADRAAGAPTATTAFADDAEMDAMPQTGGGGGEAQQPAVEVREDFQQTPLWEGQVVTDENGFATVSLELPDNLTTWTFDARVITAETEVGQVETEVVTTLPLLVRPTTPRFFVVDDRLELAAVVNNNSPEEQTVEVTLESTGVSLESDVTTTLTIPANGRGRAEWDVVVQDVEFVDLTFIAIGADGYQDAAKPQLATGPDGTIPVYRYSAPDRVGTSGVLRENGARVEGISLPTRFEFIEGDLVLNASPSLAAATTEALDYLQNYEHQCIEQTVSRFLPNIANFRALRDLGIQDPALEAKLFDALNFALDKLSREQNTDGGWGWFTGMESNPLVTAYAALGLIEARDAGFDVDQTMIDRALNFVRQNYIRPSINASYWELNRQAFYFYVLAQDGEGSKSDFDALYEFRLNMSLSGRAYLTMAYHALFPAASEIDDLVSDFTTNALVSATGVHWEEAQRDWWNWGSNTRTTSLVLNALIKTTPESDLLPNAVRWLMVARDGDHWQTTQENVWALLALTDWMVLTNELQGNYDYTVSLNRDEVLSGDVTPENVRDENQLRIAVEDLLLDDLNRLVISRDEGEGALYYTAHLDLRLPASQVSELSRGITVTREYFAEDDPETPITSATVGDTVNVRLTITLPEDVYYFVLEDPIPAGTEAVDTNLLTTSQQADGPGLVPSDENEWRWFWGWWYFDHTELRDEQVNLYADYLPRGTYTYTYQLQATVPGEFQTMPAEGYAFYFPEVFGRTDGQLFTVEDRAFGVAD